MNALAVLEPRTRKGSHTREAILAKAMDIASVQGLDGLTIGTLAEALDLSKSGLFAHFGSKEELQLATIQAARGFFAQEVMVPGLKARKGLPRLCSVIATWLDYAEREVFRGGCFFTAVSAEFDSRPGPVKDQVADCMTEWVDALARLVKEAKDLGELDRKADPRQLAWEFNSLAMGANNTYQLQRDPIVFTFARKAIRDRLKVYAPEGTRFQLR
ncbi:MAG: TetR/AcrR family transcriptional regulator [Holophagaceae bacterium]|nr:TetR/AcrR family transcriptional regulator [Holophagaceae bacterium]